MTDGLWSMVDDLLAIVYSLVYGLWSGCLWSMVYISLPNRVNIVIESAYGGLTP